MSNPNCYGNRLDKVALRTTCIKNVKLKFIKIRTGCQYVGYFHCSWNLNWVAQNLWLGRMARRLDTAELDNSLHCFLVTCLLESCAGWVDPRRLWVHTFSGRVELAAGWGGSRLYLVWVQVEKLFVRVTECWAKAHKLNSSKIPKYLDVLKLPTLHLGQQACSSYYIMM